jgi:HSP20 family protein
MTDLKPFTSSIDDLLSGFFVRPVNFESESRGVDRPAHFRIDVYETENAYRVVADLPGIRKDDINITISGAEVAISADAKHEQTAGNGEKALLNERFEGKYYRAFTLGHEIDEGNAQARYVDGVLELTLPKSPDAMPKKITIQ